MKQIGFIGTGNMAGAIIAQILDSGTLPPEKVGVFDILPDKLERYRQAGQPVYQSVGELVSACDTIFLSVKPQNFPEILPLVRERMTPDKLLVSIAAGIGAKYIHEQIGFPCKLVFVMPNTPILIGAGSTSLSRVEPTSPEEFEQIRQIFALGGIAEEVPPDRMNSAMSIHSTIPAYIYLYAKTIVECAAETGVDCDVANRLFCQALIGAAKMMTETGKGHQELIDMVCSPGGTTLAGMAALEEAGFTDAIRSAFYASIRRAEELAK